MLVSCCSLSVLMQVLMSFSVACYTSFSLSWEHMMSWHCGEMGVAVVDVGVAVPMVVFSLWLLLLQVFSSCVCVMGRWVKGSNNEVA